jgi:hypothetical protein
MDFRGAEPPALLIEKLLRQLYQNLPVALEHKTAKMMY